MTTSYTAFSNSIPLQGTDTSSTDGGGQVSVEIKNLRWFIQDTQLTSKNNIKLADISTITVKSSKSDEWYAKRNFEGYNPPITTNPFSGNGVTLKKVTDQTQIDTIKDKDGNPDCKWLYTQTGTFYNKPSDGYHLYCNSIHIYLGKSGGQAISIASILDADLAPPQKTTVKRGFNYMPINGKPSTTICNPSSTNSNDICVYDTTIEISFDNEMDIYQYTPTSKEDGGYTCTLSSLVIDKSSGHITIGYKNSKYLDPQSDGWENNTILLSLILWVKTGTGQNEYYQVVEISNITGLIKDIDDNVKTVIIDGKDIGEQFSSAKYQYSANKFTNNDCTTTTTVDYKNATFGAIADVNYQQMTLSSDKTSVSMAENMLDTSLNLGYTAKDIMDNKILSNNITYDSKKQGIEDLPLSLRAVYWAQDSVTNSNTNKLELINENVVAYVYSQVLNTNPVSDKTCMNKYGAKGNDFPFSSICWNSSGQNYCNRDGFTGAEQEKCSKTLCFRSSNLLGPNQLGWSLTKISGETTSQEKTLELFTEENMHDPWMSNEPVGDNTESPPALKSICYVKPTFITNIVAVTN